MPAHHRIMPWKDPPRTWYTLDVWRKRRRYQLMLQPVCSMCAQQGLAVGATIADHIKPHNGDWFKFLWGPLQSLCKPCHDKDKRYLDLHGFERTQFGADGWPVEANATAKMVVK
jgi:hypothetical protein